MFRIIRTINIIVLLAIFYFAFLKKNIKLSPYNYFIIAIVSIFLVNILPIIVKIYDSLRYKYNQKEE